MLRRIFTGKLYQFKHYLLYLHKLLRSENGELPSVTLISKSLDTSHFHISKENLHQEGNLRAALKQSGVLWNDGVSAVSIVGTGINESHEKILSGTRALDRAGIEYYGAATSSFRVTWIVAREKVQAAVERLHALFIEGAATLVP